MCAPQATSGCAGSGAPGGAAARAAAALRIGNVLGSVLTARRLHGPAERWLTAPGGSRSLSPSWARWPRVLAWPLAVLSLWLGLALLARAARKRAATLLPRPPAPGSPPPPP